MVAISISYRDDANTSSALAVEKSKKKSDLNSDAVSNSVVVGEDLQSDSESNPDQETCPNENEERNRDKNPAKRLKRAPVRKYNDSYLSYGFICAGTNDLTLPQCLLCSTVFKNSAMKPAPLKIHLLAVHKKNRTHR